MCAQTGAGGLTVTIGADAATTGDSGDFMIAPPPATATRVVVTGTGITNLKVIRPGYAPDTTQVFTDEYLKHLEQFGVLRFMSFTNTWSCASLL